MGMNNNMNNWNRNGNIKKQNGNMKNNMNNWNRNGNMNMSKSMNSMNNKNKNNMNNWNQSTANIKKQNGNMNMNKTNAQKRNSMNSQTRPNGQDALNGNIKLVSTILEAKELNVSNKEAYLPDHLFFQVFNQTKEQFYAQRPWKQKQMKRNTGFW